MSNSNLEWEGEGTRFMDINTTNELLCEPALAYTFGFVVALRVCVSITCVLSMFGASLIIGTFVAFKELRTKARQILVQLSIADFLVASSQLFGVNINLPKLMENICIDYEGNQTNVNFTDDIVCQVQGGITVFSTVSSYYWTLTVAFYLLVIIVFESQRVGRWLMYFSYVVCWGIPAVLVFNLGFLKFLGFRPNLYVGWCYINEGFHHNPNHKIPEIISQIFVYITYIILPVVYIWIRCRIRFKLKRVSKNLSISDKLQTRTRNADVKLTFIPLIFLCLNLWGTILGIHYIYLSSKMRMNFSRKDASAALILLASVGGSAQGLMNSLLFCVFTKIIRNKLWNRIKYCVSFGFKKDEAKVYRMEPSTCLSVSTTQYGDGEDEDWMKERREYRPDMVSINNSNPKTKLLSESLGGFKYHSLNVGKSVLPD